MRARITVTLIACMAMPLAAAAPVFEPAAIAEWPRKVFDGEVDYRLVQRDGRAAVEAVADDTATALYREIEVDLERTPVLEWTWRVEQLPDGAASERTKDGDDYAARIYVVREGLFGQLSARALNYAWTRELPAGETWPNAFTGRARMISVQSGTARAGEWITYRRDLSADWRAAFGETPGRVHGVAVMTDTDNTGGRARALYGTIRFLPRKEN